MNETTTAQEIKPDQKPEIKAVAIRITERGLFDFKDHIELGNAASMMIKIKEAPDHLAKEGREAVAAALLFCKQFNLPQKAMNQMAFIKGKLSAFGSLVTAIAEKHPLYGSKREFFVDENCDEICVSNKNLKANVFAAVVQIRKKNDEHWTEYTFSVEDAARAELLEPTRRDGTIILDSPWIKYRKDMLMHKARKRALQSEYASALEGIDYYEDARDIRDVTPINVSAVKNDFDQIATEFSGGVLNV